MANADNWNVEVVYLKNGSFASRKVVNYPQGEARRVYQATVTKFTELSTAALVMLRNSTDELVTIERTGPK